MNSASTSTASLITPSHPSSSKPKNYEQAFGNLSSSFGFAGSVVSAPCVQNVSNSNSDRSSLWRKYSSSFFSSAGKQKRDLKVAAQQQPAAYPANAQSLSQSQSQSQSQSEKKNFEAAYGDLASRHGFGGGPKSSKV